MLGFIILVKDAVRWIILEITMKDAMNSVRSGHALLMLLRVFITTILINMFTDLLISTMLFQQLLDQQKIKDLSFKQALSVVQSTALFHMLLDKDAHHASFMKLSSLRLTFNFLSLDSKERRNTILDQRRDVCSHVRRSRAITSIPQLRLMFTSKLADLGGINMIRRTTLVKQLKTFLLVNALVAISWTRILFASLVQ